MSKLIEKLLAEKKLVKRGPHYGMIIDEKFNSIGMNKEKVEEKLIELGYSLEENSPESLVLKTQPKVSFDVEETQTQITPKVLHNKAISKKEMLDGIAKQLGDINDLKPFSEAGTLAIFINGIDSRLVTDSPIKLVWRSKSKNTVDVGDKIRNKDYVVVNKNWPGVRETIKVAVDETPNGPNFVYQEMTLCMTDMLYYKNKKEARRLKFELAYLKADKLRKEQLVKSGKDEDIENYVKDIEKQNRADFEREKKSLRENQDYNDSQILKLEAQLASLGKEAEKETDVSKF